MDTQENAPKLFQLFQVLPEHDHIASFATLRDAIEVAENRARQILRDYQGADATVGYVGPRGFTLTIGHGGSIAALGATLCALECSPGAGYADWQGIERPRVQRVLRADYYKDVRNVALNALSEVADGSINDSEALDTWLHETIDGHSTIIYTHSARLCLMYSDNENAFADEFGITEGATIEARAYMAMRADVRDLLSALCDTSSPFEHCDGLNEADAQALRAGGHHAGPFDMNDDGTYPATLPDSDTLRESALEHCARMLTSLAWASAVDHARETGVADAPNLSGCDICELAPEPTEQAEKAAHDLFAKLETLNGADNGVLRKPLALGAFIRGPLLAAVRAEDTSADVDKIAERFGDCMAYETLGHGVSWTDDYAPHGLTVPHGEYMESFEFPMLEGAPFIVGEYELGEVSFSIVDRDGRLFVQVEGYA